MLIRSLFITFVLCDVTGQLEKGDLNSPQYMQRRLFTKIMRPQRSGAGSTITSKANKRTSADSAHVSDNWVRIKRIYFGRQQSMDVQPPPYRCKCFNPFRRAEISG